MRPISDNPPVFGRITPASGRTQPPAAAPLPQLYRGTPVRMGYATPGISRAPQLTGMFTSPEGFPIYAYTLHNGHRVLLENRPTDLVSLRTFVNSGSVYEDPIHPSPLYPRTPHPSGIAHLDEHCHFLTTQNFPEKNSWAQAVEKRGTRLNASTEDELIQHEMLFNGEDLPAMLDLHAESLLRATYDDASIKQEKSNVLNEISQHNFPVQARIVNKVRELLFDRPSFQTGGRREDVANTTAEQLRRFQHTFYVPSNMLTVVSGRFNPLQVLSSLDRQFGGNPARAPGADPNAGLRVALPPTGIRSATIHDPGLSSSVINLAFPGPSASNLRDRMAMEFLVELLTGGPTSLLTSQVQNQQRLASGVDAGFTPMKNAGQFNVLLHTRPGQEQAALQSSLNAIQGLSHWVLTPEKLAKTRDKLVHRFRANLNDAEKATMQLGMESMTGSLPFYLQYEQLASSLTPQDIQTAAARYLNPNRYAVVFGVPQTSGGPQS